MEKCRSHARVCEPELGLSLVSWTSKPSGENSTYSSSLTTFGTHGFTIDQPIISLLHAR